MVDPSVEVGTLVQLLKDKKNILGEILELSKQQTIVIENEKIDKLEKIINNKQVRIDRVDNIDKVFSNKLDNIKTTFKVKELTELNINRDLLVNLKNTTLEVINLVKEIAEIESKNKSKINKSFDEVKSKLRNVKTGKKVASNYYKQSAQTGGYFIDKQK